MLLDWREFSSCRWVLFWGISDMLDAKKAFKEWQNLHKINLRVYTDEQMFEIGFNYSQALIKELANLVDELDLTIKGLKNEAVRTKKRRQVPNPE